jgi:hypothetical protein
MLPVDPASAGALSAVMIRKLLPGCAVIGCLVVAASVNAAEIVAEPGEAGLRAAVSTAQDGDTVVVTNWVELTAPLRIEKRLTVSGRDTAGIWRTAIHGSFDGALLDIAAEGIVFETLRFIGSAQTDGFLVNHELVLRDCSIEACRNPAVNFGWFDPGFSLRLERVLVDRNGEGLRAYALEAKDSVFSHNRVFGAVSWISELEGCLFEYNQGDGLNVAYGQVRNCVFRFNESFGLRFDPDPGIMYLGDSLFYANGGGALLLREQAEATIDNCTFTRHTGKPAIVATEYNNILFRHCTIVDNVVLEPWSIPSPDETGGAFVIENGSSVELQNCLIANNPTSADPDASGLIGSWIDGGGNVIGGDPMLDPLHNNGGPLPTLLPRPGSPAIDAGIASELIRDARGLSRIAGAAPDAGAVEADALPLADEDADGLPDLWETFHGLSPADPLDALLDTDADGQNALNEFYAGTDPADGSSAHKVETVILTPAPVLQPFPRTVYVTWTAYPGVKYELEMSLDMQNWEKVPGWHMPDGGGTSRRLSVYRQISTDHPAMFYRVQARGHTFNAVGAAAK